MQEELQHEQKSHAQDREALAEAADQADHLSADLRKQQGTNEHLAAEEAKLRSSLAAVQAALDDAERQAAQQVAALQAAVQEEENARREAERLAASDRAAAEQRLQQEVDRASKAQVRGDKPAMALMLLILALPGMTIDWLPPGQGRSGVSNDADAVVGQLWWIPQTCGQ